MHSVTIHSSTNRLEVQRDLKSFGWMAAFDASITNDGKVLLQEVSFIDRIKRVITGNEENEKRSQDALLKLAEINPAIRMALGSSIRDAGSWSASELRARLRLPAEKLIKNEAGTQFRIPVSDAVGLATIVAEESDADFAIRWKIIPANGKVQGSGSTESSSANSRVTQYEVVAQPSESKLENLYAKVLQDAIDQGRQHVALTPVPDEIKTGEFHQIFEAAFSDTSIKCLLAAIESVQSTHPSTPRITITTDRIPGLADRIKDLQSQREARKADDQQPKENVAAMPPALKVMALGLQNLPKAPAVLSISGVERIKEFDSVHLYWDDPHRLSAETMILQSGSLLDAAGKLAGQGFPELGRIVDMMSESGRLLGNELEEVTASSRLIWGVDALEVLPCELSTSRLFALNMRTGVYITADQAERFFLDHFQNTKGRIVIDLPENANARTGLLNAIRTYKNSEKGKSAEIVLATNVKKIYEDFSGQLK